MRGFHGAVDHYLGLLAALRRDFDRAEALFEAAANASRSGMDHAPRVCRTWMAWADTIARRVPDDAVRARGERSISSTGRSQLAAERELPRTARAGVRAARRAREPGVTRTWRALGLAALLTGCNVASSASVTTTVPVVVSSSDATNDVGPPGAPSSTRAATPSRP